MEDKYVLFIEENFYKPSIKCTYLQYNGNEKQIKLLHNIISSATYTTFVDYSKFYIDINNIIDNCCVNKHLDINIGINKLFSVCKGKFFIPVDIKNLENIDGDKLCELLDELFYNGKIENYWSNFSC